VRVEVLEVGGDQSDGDASTEAMPCRVVVVHLVSKMSRQGFPVQRALG
jgi:hypothetical protein